MAITKEDLSERIKNLDYQLKDIVDKMKILNDQKLELTGKRNGFQEVYNMLMEE